MALPAANLRLFNRLLAQLAVRRNFNGPDKAKEGPLHLGVQGHVFASIGAENFRDRAFTAKVGCPVSWRRGVPDKPAFFLFAPTKIIAIEILAFKTGGRAHDFPFQLRSICPHFRGDRQMWLK